MIYFYLYSHSQLLTTGSRNYKMEKLPQTLNPIITVYFLASLRVIYICLLSSSSEKAGLLASTVIFSGRLS